MARLYHALSSYKLGDDFPAPPADHPLVLQDLVTNDFATWPYAYKRYAEDLPRTPLPRELSGLGRVLYLSAGVVRTTEREGRPTLLFRAAGSAGGRFPLELYVSRAGRRPLVRPGGTTRWCGSHRRRAVRRRR